MRTVHATAAASPGQQRHLLPDSVENCQIEPGPNSSQPAALHPTTPNPTVPQLHPPASITTASYPFLGNDAVAAAATMMPLTSDDRIGGPQPSSNIVPPDMPSSGAAGGRFGFVSSMRDGIARLVTAPPLPPERDDDRLLDLDIEVALFSNPATRDLAPAEGFDRLETHAISLLAQFQTAYQRRTVELKVTQAELSAQRDELVEAESRARHLKLQLDAMARKAADQEQAMSRLVDELAAKRRAGHEEAAMSEALFGEDLAGDEDEDRRRRQRRRRRRKSAVTTATMTTMTTLSLDTDEESLEEASIFSTSRSPPTTPSTFEGSGRSTACSPTRSATSSRVTSIVPPKPGRLSGSQISTFQKMLRGISTEPSSSGASSASGASQPPGGCRKCGGQEASVAWDTAGLMRDENRALKQRVEELEATFEGVLDLVNGVGV